MTGGQRGAETAEGSSIVDARGLRCPLPVIRLAAVARDMPPGALVTVWSTDPAAEHDVPAWARMRGHRVVDATRELREGDEHLALTVELGAPATGPGAGTPTT